MRLPTLALLLPAVLALAHPARAQACPELTPIVMAVEADEPECPGAGSGAATAALAGTPPTLSLAPYHPAYVTAARGSVEHRYATPAYISQDQPRSVTLLYSSNLAAPTATVQVDATDNSAAPPTRMSIKLRSVLTGAMVTFTNGSQELFYSAGAGTTRLAAQFDVSALQAQTYWYDLYVTSWFADGTSAETAPQRISVVVSNETASPVGRGWIVGGVQRLVPQGGAGVTLYEGDGTARLFTYPGSCVTGYYGSEWCSYTTPEGDFSRLARNTISGVYERYYPDGRVVQFRSDGRMAWDADQGKTTFGYDAQARLNTVTDPAGAVTQLGYDAAGRLAWIQDPSGRRVNVTVNASGMLASICDAKGCPLQAGYDGAGRMSWRTDRAGSRWDFTYDAFGQLARVDLPSIAVDGRGTIRPTETQRSLEAAVLPAAGTGSAGAPAARVLPANARVVMTDATLNATEIEVDRFGLPLRVQQPLGRVTQYLRDAHGRPTRVTAFNGDITEYTYQGAYPATVRDVANNVTTTYTYTSVYGAPHAMYPFQSYLTYPLTVSTPGSPPSVFEKFGTRVLPTRMGAARAYYDEVDYATGRPGVVYGPGQHVRYFYAATGLQNLDSMLVTQGTDGVTTSFTRDAQGRVVFTDGALDQLDERVSYDALNRVDSVTTAAGVVRFSYAPGGWLQGVTDGKGQQYSFGRNALGWSEWEQDPRAGVLRTTYDAAGRVASGTNRRGQTVRYTYDTLGRMSTQTSHEGGVTTWGYDPQGRWVSVSNGESSDTLRIVRGATPSVDQVMLRGGLRYTLNTRRDTAAATVRVSTSWGYDVTHGYLKDGTQRLRELRDGRVGLSTTVAYDSVANTTRYLFPTGDTLLYAADSLRFTDPSGSVLNRGYVHDWLQRVDRVGPSDWEYSKFWYDTAGRLESEVFIENGWWTHVDQYSWDAVGNPTYGSAVVTAGNRLESFDGWTLQYDADGNVVRRTKAGVADQTLTWNSLGQLVGVTGAGLSVTYGYDGQGRRVRRTLNGVTTRFLFDGHHVVAETDAAGTVTREFTYYPGVDRPHSMRTGGQTYYYITDLQGNVVALANASGTVVNRYVYTPFGTTTQASETVANPLRYAGREYDAETGLYNYRARYYDPALGRFLSEDPMGIAAGINLYAYAGSDPVNGADPTGLDPCGSFQKMVNGKCVEDPAKAVPLACISNLADYCAATPEESPVSAMLWQRLHERRYYVHDPADEIAYMEALDREAYEQQMAQQRADGIRDAVHSMREVADVGVGFIPGVATVHDVSVLLTGYNAVTGDKVGVLGRVVAAVGVLTPLTGGELRGAWKLTEEGTSRVMRHVRWGTSYAEHATTGLWWSKDVAGHGKSVWKVFTQEGDALHWLADADEFGDFILNKHKGPTGLVIPFKDLVGR